MKYDWKFFENFLDNIENHSDEEVIEIMPLWIAFMRQHQKILGLTDEHINSAAEKHEAFVQSYEDAKRAERELELANKKADESLDVLEEALFDAMEKNGGKPIPMFLDLPKKKNNSN
jgi:hypothetical protein